MNETTGAVSQVDTSSYTESSTNDIVSAKRSRKSKNPDVIVTKGRRNKNQETLKDTDINDFDYFRFRFSDGKCFKFPIEFVKTHQKKNNPTYKLKTIFDYRNYIRSYMRWSEIKYSALIVQAENITSGYDSEFSDLFFDLSK